MRHSALFTLFVACAGLAACTSPGPSPVTRPAPEPAPPIEATEVVEETAVEPVVEETAPNAGSVREYLNSFRSIDE